MERVNSQEVKEDEEKPHQDCLTTLVPFWNLTGSSDLRVKLTKKPIELQWCCGVNPKIDVIDLTTQERVLSQICPHWEDTS